VDEPLSVRKLTPPPGGVGMWMDGCEGEAKMVAVSGVAKHFWTIITSQKEGGKGPKKSVSDDDWPLWS
jgi:hypothetical protein